MKPGRPSPESARLDADQGRAQTPGAASEGPSEGLTGKLLIAMPGMNDPRFARSVICICAHSDTGAMGLVINRPLPELRLHDLLERLELPQGQAPDLSVHYGGPVEVGRGFVLHSAEYQVEGATLTVTPDIAMTATLDVLSDISRGAGPEHALMALGYAGWAPGQLEEEILQNGWLTVDSAPDMIFATEDSQKWARALNALGVDPTLLSAAAGHA